jgi:hypothetical protein
MSDVAITDLDPAMQATGLPGPIARWGSIARSSPMPGTYHFYVHDYKFSALARRPGQLVDSGCKVAVEPNYSTWPGMGEEKALEGIARKRLMGRFWQARGVRIVVDLNLDPAFRHLALLGVPPGWAAYATRQQQGVPFESLEDDWRQAVAHAGTEDILFCVFGGWRKVRDLCRERGWIWTAEDLHRARGSSDGTRAWR